MAVTLAVLNLLTSMLVSFEQLQNIYPIFVVVAVLKLLRFSDVKPVQP